jgi:hypothetical protein
MVWRLEAYPGPSGACKMVINDGRLVYLDHHDDNIYSLGKGPSATTVSAPQTNPLLGSSVTIIGTVTDQTASGRINVAGSKDFTLKGTPAISDASMEAWMEYMFQQRPKPANATGVLVQLDAVDPNGNYIHIGNVTSDLTGAYGCNWTPEVSGTYQIIAKFDGSASYGGSTAQTYMTISEALPTVAPTAAPQANTATVADLITYMIVGVVAIIIAVAIVGVLLLRKHP